MTTWAARGSRSICYTSEEISQSLSIPPPTSSIYLEYGVIDFGSFKQMMTSAERLRIIKEALADARDYYRTQLDELYGTFIPQYVPAFYSDALAGR